MDENKVRKRKLNISGILAVLGMLVAIIGIIYIIVALPKETSLTSTIYSYNTRKNSNYKVNLNPEYNDFYENLIGENNSTYPSIAINSFDINLIYLFEGSDLEDIVYSYYVTADIIGELSESATGSSKIWEKNYTLTETKTNELKAQKSFSINEPVNINYWDYANIVNDYKDVFSMSINSYLRLRLNINYTIKSIDSSFDNVANTEIVEVRIPLGTSVSKVNANYEQLYDNSVTKTTINKPDYIILSIGLFFVLLAIILFLIANNKKVVTKSSLYKKNMEKIYKEYGDLIVTVKNRPNIKGLRLMALSNIDDLVDVADQNKSNIINYEIPKKYESFLLVITNGYVYVYIVTEEEISYSNK